MSDLLDPNAERPFHPVADIFPMMSDREFRDLVDDIATHGLHEPVWLHTDGRIVDGRNRYLACRELGIEPVTRMYEGDDSDLVFFVVSLNLHRRHLSESQRAMVATRIATLSDGQRADRVGTEISVPTQAQAAQMLSVSVDSVQFARKVSEHAEPEVAEAVTAGKVAVSTAATLADAPAEQQRDLIGALGSADGEAERRAAEKAIVKAAQEIKQRKKEERIAEKAKAVAEIAARTTMPLDSIGPFPILYADPPWRYDYAEDTSRQIENHYPTMPLDDIKKLDIPAADDAVLFLWVTSPKLVEGIEVMEAWGFEYRTSMVWIKDRIGMGYYARQQHELLLIGKRGSLPVPDPEDRPSSVVHASRGEHSAKPDEVYELIERMYPLRERCELFQRRPRDGWSGWGNQAEGAT